MFRYTHITLGDIHHYRLRSALTIAGIAVIVAVFLGIFLFRKMKNKS